MVTGQDTRLRGIVLFLVAISFFSGSDVLAKVVTESLPTIEVVWIRYCVFVILAFALIRAGGGRFRVATPSRQIWRGLGLMGSGLCFVMSLQTLPMAEAATIGFTSPLLITLLSAPLLGERVGLRRWLAVAIGMVGVLVVVRPGAAAFDVGALWVVGSSLSWAVAIIITRRMSGADAPSMLMWSALTGVVVLSFIVPFVFVMPSLHQLGLAVAVGVLATAGQYFMVLAYRHAAASVLAPFSYVQMLYAIVSGFLVFGALPDGLTLLGGGIVAVSGLWSAQNERRVARGGSTPAA